MIKNLLQDKKKRYIWGGIIIISLLIGIYIYALTRPGVWHGKTFMYLQADESYVGDGKYFDYHMTITEHADGTDITFSVGTKIRNYLVQTDADGYAVTIYQGDTLLFDGFYNHGFLMSDDGLDFNITVSTSSDFKKEPLEEDYFPTNTQLYNWAVMEKPDMRGNFTFVLYLAFATAYLVVDFCFPDFFFHMKHFMTVDGGTPTEFYRMGQWLGRIAMFILAIVCVFISLRH